MTDIETIAELKAMCGITAKSRRSQFIDLLAANAAGVGAIAVSRTLDCDHTKLYLMYGYLAKRVNACAGYSLTKDGHGQKAVFTLTKA